MNWEKFKQQEFQKDYFKKLINLFEEETKNYTIYPPRKDLFKAFDLCSLDMVKLLIFGQDPYHSYDKQAMGLSFAVSKGVAIPPSLKNIFKELKNDLNIDSPNHGCLEAWAKQGVLLLNSILTVRKGEPGSHQHLGWQEFTDNVIKLINEQDRPIVYFLWGNFAKSKAQLITNPKHYVIACPHPSPYSANNGFFGSKCFSKANDFLVKNGIEPINWKLD